jgi:two-component system, LuxR family, response regulator FixJ
MIGVRQLEVDLRSNLQPSCFDFLERKLNSKSDRSMILENVVAYLVDDDESMTLLMSSFLAKDGIPSRSFTSGTQFLAELDDSTPCCLVVDFQMPEMSGLELIHAVRMRHPHMPFVLVTGKATVAIAVVAMKLGAITVIEKPFVREDFVESVRAAISAEKAEREAYQKLLIYKERLGLLTMREREVADLVVKGNLTKQIAKSLGISIKTVEVHRSKITKKLGVNSVAQLVKMYVELDASESASRLQLS